jgi:ankyrin repeat protein
MNQSVVIANRTTPIDLLLLDSGGDTPLHCLLQARAPHQVLRTTIETSPVAVFSTASNTGRLPIHEAIQHGAAIEIVRLLLVRSPSDALEIPDAEGRLPILLLSSHSPKEVAELLIRLCPSGVLLREDNKGMLPLHCALSSKAQMDVITLLVDKSPSSLSATDNKRQLPVHVAFSLYAGTGRIYSRFGTIAYGNKTSCCSLGTQQSDPFGTCRRDPKTYKRGSDRTTPRVLSFQNSYHKCAQGQKPICFDS